MRFAERYYDAISVEDVKDVFRRFGGIQAEGVLRVPRDMVVPIQRELVRLRCPGVKVVPNDRRTSTDVEDEMGKAREVRAEMDRKKAERKLIEQEERLRKAR